MLVESNLKEGSITVEDNALKVADNEDGITAADLAANISGVVINGEPLGSRNPGAIVMNEDGSINLDAELSSRDGSSTPVFAEAGENTVEFTIDGYPSVTGTVTK